MFYKRIIPYILSFVLLSGSIYYVADTQEVGTESSDSTPTQIAVEKPTQEIRGVWVTYMTLDVSGKSDKESAFKEKIDTVISDMKKRGSEHDDRTGSAVLRRALSVKILSVVAYPDRNTGEDPDMIRSNTIITMRMRTISWCTRGSIPIVSAPRTRRQLSHDHPAVKDQSIGVEVNGGVYLNPA